MFEHVCVEIFDQLRMVLRKVFVRAESRSEQNHVFRSNQLRKFALYLLEKRVVEKFISDCNLLALVKALKEVVQTSVFKSRLEMGDLFLTFGLEFPENGFSLLTLGAAEKAIENCSTRRIRLAATLLYLSLQH